MKRAIVIIGAGPRGTYGLRRLSLSLARQRPAAPVDIHVIEQSGNFGGGGVHDPKQPPYLLLNTVASQITAFGDDDAEARKDPARKSLHGYLVGRGIDIDPNDYPSRAQHGQYLAAAYDWTEQTLPPGARLIRRVRAAADIEPGDPCQVILDDGETIRADEVLLVTGHSRLRIDPGSAEAAWSAFAASCREKGHNAHYVHDVYPIDQNTRRIRPGESVYVIGMGLTGIDVVKALTTGRGGRFEGGDYRPSGEEPHIILGSRLGIPYCARAHNQKTGQYQGRILTPEAAAALTGRGKKLDFEADLFPLILREMEYVYYSTLLGKDFGERCLACEDDAARRTLIRENVPKADRFSWTDLRNPLHELEARRPPGKPLFKGRDDYMGFVMNLIRADIAEAEKGNTTSPLKNAVDSVLRDLRDIIRQTVNFGGLTPRSHRFLNTEFDRVNNRIAVGPPVRSSRELLRLMETGIVSLSGPGPVLSMDEDRCAFFIESRDVPGSGRHVQHVLNGRIHGVRIRKDAAPLMRNLLKRGLIRPYVNADADFQYEIGGLDVDDAFHIIGADGGAAPNICAIGIPTEGKIWFNAADARPDVGSTAITQLDCWAGDAVRRIIDKEEREGK